MSEKNWEEKIAEIVKKQLENWKPPQTAPPSSSEHQHFKEGDPFCPDCYPAVKKAVLEKEILARKDYPLECVNCGTRVNLEDEECPTCGGKDARERE